jgi:phage-related protein
VSLSEVADLYIILRAVTAPMTAALKAAGVEGDAAATGIGKSMNKIAPISKALTEGLLLGAAASVKWASDFQTQYTRLWTAAGAAKDQVLANTDAMLKLGNQTGFTGTQIAEALYHPISAGLSMAQSLEVVKNAAMEAQISGASLDDTTYSLSSVMKAFNYPVQDTTSTMAMLNAVVGDGDMHFQDFNASIKNWAPSAAQMGISIQSMGSGLAYLTDRGNSAEEASTRLTMGLSMMATPSAQAAKLLEGLGVASADVKGSTQAMTDVLKKAHITQNQLAEDLAKPDGLYVALHHLQQALKDAGVSGTEANSAIAKIFGGGRSDKAILSLMQNLDGLKQKYDQIGHDAAVANFQKAWEDAQKTLKVQFDQLKASAIDLGIKIGEKLIPIVDKLMNWFLKGTDWLSKHKVAMAALAGVVVALMIPAIYGAVAAFAALAVAAGPFILVGAAIGAVAYEIYTHWSTIVAFLKEAWKWIREAASDTAKWISHAWDDVWKWVSKAWDDVVGFLKGVWKGISKIWDDTGGKAVHAIARAWDAISGAVTKEWGKIVADLRAIWTNLTVIWNATGGKLVHLIYDNWNAIYKDVLKPIWDYIVGMFTADLDIISGLFQGAWDAITGIFDVAWTAICGIVQVAWDVVSGIVQVGLDVVTTVFKVAWDVVKGVFKTAWDAICGVVNTALDLIKNVTKFFADLLTGRWSKLGSDLWNIVKGLWNDIYGLFKSVLGDIWNLVVSVVKDIWNGFVNAIVDAWDAIWKALKDLVGHIFDFFKGCIKWLWQVGKDIIMGIVNGFKAMWDASWNAISSLWDHVFGFFKGCWNWLWQVGKDIIGGLVDGFKFMWRACWDASAWIWDKISGFFVGCWNWLYRTGKDIIQGLIDGIVSMGNAVGDAVKGVFGGAIGIGKSILGIHSPSTVFREMGQNAIQGLVDGLTGGLPSVHATISAVSSALTAGMMQGPANPGIQYGPGQLVPPSRSWGDGAPSSIVVNVNGSVLAERDLRDLMETQMLQLGGRRPATYAAYVR